MGDWRVDGIVRDGLVLFICIVAGPSLLIGVAIGYFLSQLF